MNHSIQSSKSGLSIGSILRALCPSCREGKVMQGMSVRPRCPKCGYNFYPEPGFYLGAMVVGFFMTAVLTVPPVIVLKFMEVDTAVLIAFPFFEFLFVGTFLLFYCKIIWLHFEHRISSRLDQNK